mmetsp:Transcript_6565/g.7507  ORF Transcript_6565/g.7507 Transcript_6565/m.7507 type:complete len:295 (+) Transcript_6565:232-1116(+)
MESTLQSLMHGSRFTLDSLRKLKRNLLHLQLHEKQAGATAMALIWIGALLHARKSGFVKSTLSSGFITGAWIIAFTVVVEIIQSNFVLRRMVRLYSDPRIIKEVLSAFLGILFLVLAIVKALFRVSFVGLALQTAAFGIVSAIIIAAKMYEVRLDAIRRRGIQNAENERRQQQLDQGQGGYFAAVQALQHRDLTPEDYTILQALDEFVTRPNVASSPEVIKSLPTHVLTARDLRSQQECCVCLCDFVQGETVKTLTCFHQGHHACIDAWLTVRGVCPVCNITITVDDIGFESDE